MAYIFQFKRGQSNSWANKNILLEAGEPGFEIDTGRLKIGDGKKPWNELPYIAGDETFIEGYYFENHFYKDLEHQVQLKDLVGPLYLDKIEKILYIYDGINYYALGTKMELATSEKVGAVKPNAQEFNVEQDGTLSLRKVPANVIVFEDKPLDTVLKNITQTLTWDNI